MRYDAVIFDLDGTLLDTLGDLAASVNHALASFSYAPRTLDEVRSFVGNGVRTLNARSLPGGFDNPDYEAVFAAFQAHYASHCRDTTCPYPHIMELVQALKAKGVKLAIVSNKSDPEVKKLNDEFFEGQFLSAIGERPDVQRKPAPDSLLQTMKDLGCEPARSVYVGDSEVDVMTARNAGVDCIAVTWGFRSPEQLQEAGASVLIDSPMELLEKI